MKYHFLLVLIMMLRVGFAANADDSVKDGWQLMASHVNGFIPKMDKDSKGAALERTVFLWLYVKNCTQSPRRFPTRGLSNDHNNWPEHPTLGVYLVEIDNPLNERVVVGPSEYAVVEVPPGQSVLLYYEIRMPIFLKAGLEVDLLIEGKAAELAKVDPVRLKCESQLQKR